MAHHNFVSFVDVEELHRARRRSFAIDRDGAIHHRAMHLDFFAADTHKRLLIRRHVKVSRENAIGRRLGQLHIRALAQFSAMLPETQQQFIQRFACLGGNFDSRETLVRASLADLDLSDFEIRAARKDLIQHLRQNE